MWEAPVRRFQPSYRCGQNTSPARQRAGFFVAEIQARGSLAGVFASDQGENRGHDGARRSASLGRSRRRLLGIVPGRAQSPRNGRQRRGSKSGWCLVARREWAWRYRSGLGQIAGFFRRQQSACMKKAPAQRRRQRFPGERQDRIERSYALHKAGARHLSADHENFFVTSALNKFCLR